MPSECVLWVLLYMVVWRLLYCLFYCPVSFFRVGCVVFVLLAVFLSLLPSLVSDRFWVRYGYVVPPAFCPPPQLLYWPGHIVSWLLIICVLWGVQMSITGIGLCVLVFCVFWFLYCRRLCGVFWCPEMLLSCPFLLREWIWFVLCCPWCKQHQLFKHTSHTI